MARRVSTRNLTSSHNLVKQFT